jgi:hypothetical protein
MTQQAHEHRYEVVHTNKWKYPTGADMLTVVMVCSCGHVKKETTEVGS